MSDDVIALAAALEETRHELAAMREALADAGIGRRHLFGAALAGLGGAAIVTVAAPGTAAAATPATVGNFTAVHVGDPAGGPGGSLTFGNDGGVITGPPPHFSGSPDPGQALTVTSDKGNGILVDAENGIGLQSSSISTPSLFAGGDSFGGSDGRSNEATFSFTGDGGVITGFDVGFYGSDEGNDALTISSVAPGAGLVVRQRPGSAAYTGDPTSGGTGISSTVGLASTAISAASQTGTAVNAKTTDPHAAHDTVLASNAGLGRAVLGDITNTANSNAAVVGTTRGTGAALYGSQTSPTATGAAVIGSAGAKGRGGRFSGGAAAVTLAPGSRSSHPASGSPGDLYVDSTHRLWFCRGATSWRQLA